MLISGFPREIRNEIVLRKIKIANWERRLSMGDVIDVEGEYGEIEKMKYGHLWFDLPIRTAVGGEMWTFMCNNGFFSSRKDFWTWDSG